MTRTEAYADGWHNGRRWAENDLSNHEPVNAISKELKYYHARGERQDVHRAYSLGFTRGYRQLLADFETGRVTWEMFDQPPLGT